MNTSQQCNPGAAYVSGVLRASRRTRVDDFDCTRISICQRCAHYSRTTRFLFFGCSSLEDCRSQKTANINPNCFSSYRGIAYRPGGEFLCIPDCLCGRLGCGAVCIYGKLAGGGATIVRCLPPLGYGYTPPGKVNPSPRYTSALLGRLLRYSNYHNYDNNWHI